MTKFNRDNIIAIEVRSKEWFSRSAGGSYCASVITLTDDNHETHTISVGMVRGSEQYCVQRATETLKELRHIDDRSGPLSEGVYSNGRRIIWTTSMQTGCKMRDVEDWGKD